MKKINIKWIEKHFPDKIAKIEDCGKFVRVYLDTWPSQHSLTIRINK